MRKKVAKVGMRESGHSLPYSNATKYYPTRVMNLPRSIAKAAKPDWFIKAKQEETSA
jgi:hypothetical protein